MSNTVPVTEQLSTSRAQNLLFRSLLLSQGDFSLQWRLLLFVARAHPTWRIAEEAEQDLIAALVRICMRFLMHGWHQPLTNESIEAEVGANVQEFSAILQDNPRPARPLLLSEIIEGIVRRDHHYLMVADGRPRSTPAHSGSTPRSPHFSYFVQYGLLHRPTGAPDFDVLFRAIARTCNEQGDIWRRCLAQPDMRLCMGQVLAVHNAHYPDASVAIPAQMLLDEGPLS